VRAGEISEEREEGAPGRGQIGGAMRRTITFKGNPLTLVGRAVKEGDGAPDFRVLSGDLKEVWLSQFKDKVKIITSFPSLDTPVCDMQVKEFNKRAISLSEEVVILGISNDLPFAQKRFCEDNDIRNVVVLSDYRYSSFGINYGLLIKELKLLARAVCILDRSDAIRYIQIVGELTAPPDYDRAVENLHQVIAKPALHASGAQTARCVPCEGGIPALPRDVAERMAARIKGWELVEGVKLRKEFRFEDFAEAKYFLDLLAMVAEDQGHHPVMTLGYNSVRVTLTTHAAGGLTEDDFIMAGIIDEISSDQ
jgi:thioredoxin-dependent peroxiredoxin